MLNGTVLLAQGGGPTPVINQSLVGATLAARACPGVERVYGAHSGIRGIVDQSLLDLTHEPTASLNGVAEMPSAALGATRDKPDRDYCRAILDVCQAHGITVFGYIGGNDTADTLLLIAEAARARGQPIRCVHIPKTIDNDLVGNDHTPGYPSAARFVVQAFAGMVLDFHALPGVYIGVVMGRHAGFLTAAAALAGDPDGDGPHLIYVPEQPFEIARFLNDVRATMMKHGRCVVAVSEGVRGADGRLMAAYLTDRIDRDAHGNIQLSGTATLGDKLADVVRRRLGIARVRADTFGFLPRGFLGVVSDVDRRVAREAGSRAIELIDRLDTDGTVTIERTGSTSVSFALRPLDTVAAQTRTMPDVFLDPDRAGVTPAFHDYLRPLLGADLPTIQRLQAPPVERRELASPVS